LSNNFSYNNRLFFGAYYCYEKFFQLDKDIWNIRSNVGQLTNSMLYQESLIYHLNQKIDEDRIREETRNFKINDDDSINLTDENYESDFEYYF
jgi:hypothetical protein